VFGGFLVLISGVGAVMYRHLKNISMVETFKQLTNLSIIKLSNHVFSYILERDKNTSLIISGGASVLKAE